MYIKKLFPIVVIYFCVTPVAGFAATPKETKNTSKRNVAIEDSDSWHGKSVFERERPDYINDSARLGSFKIKPSITIEENYDSNIYATQTALKNDYITGIKPVFAVESDWSRHAISLITSADIGHYLENTHENYSDYSIGGAGRLDLLRETFLLASASTSHKHEDRGSQDAVSNAKEPTEYNQNDATISFIRSLRRISLKIDGDFSEYKYQNSVTNSGGVIQNIGRNRNQYKTTTRVGYEIIPGYEAFARGALNERDYEFTPTDAVNRDSSGYEAELGTALNLGGKTKGEVFAGYMQQNYDSVALKDVKGMKFGGNILWNITSLTSINSAIIRGIQETTEANASAYISTLYSVELEHELLYNLLVGVNTSYNTNDYIGTNATSRADNISGAGAKIKYLMNRRASIIAKYDYSNRDSNINNQDYKRNMVTLGLHLEM